MLSHQTLQGTGPGGRIVKADIESYVPGVAGVPMPAAVPGAGFTDIPVDALRMVSPSSIEYQVFFLYLLILLNK